MVTVPSTPRINTIDLASASAGPFEIGFRLFEEDAVEVYVNGDPVVSGFTIATNFVDGYDDDATITFDAALEIGDQIKMIGNMVPVRGADYGPTEKKLTEKLNLELGRLTSQVSETRKIAMQGLRTFSDQVPFVPEDGKPPVYDQALGRFKNGPSTTEISSAQGYAEEAQRIAGEFGDVEQAILGSEAARDKAQKWAENPEDNPVEPGKFSSKHWSAKSETLRDETAQLKADVEIIKTYIGSAVVPIGTLAHHYFDEVPAGWLRVQGQAVTPDMPDLRQMLIDDGATLDGNGDPLLQDPRGRVIRIWDPDGNVDPVLAREIGSFQADAMQEHGHTYTGTVANDGSGQSTRSYMIFDDSGGSVTDVPVSTNIDDSGDARISTETRMANVAYPLIIKAFHAYANLSGKIVPLGTAAEEDVEAFATAAQGEKIDASVNFSASLAGQDILLNDLAGFIMARLGATRFRTSQFEVGKDGFTTAGGDIEVTQDIIAGGGLNIRTGSAFDGLELQDDAGFVSRILTHRQLIEPTENAGIFVRDDFGFVVRLSNAPEAPVEEDPLPVPVASDGRGLFALRAKLAALKSEYTPSSVTAKLVYIADSWGEQPYIPNEMADALYDLYGQGAHGWVAASQTWGELNGVEVQYSGTVTRHDITDERGSPSGPYGLSGDWVEISDALSSVSFLNLRASTIYLYAEDRDGTFRYQVDGGSWTTVVGTDTGDPVEIEISGLDPQTTHDLVVDTTGNTGSVALVGVYATGLPGAELSKASNAAAYADDLNLYFSSALCAAILARMRPDSAFISFGTNDVSGNKSPATFKAAHSAMITALKTASPHCGVVLGSAPESQRSGTYQMSDYRDATVELHQELENVEFLNLLDLFGDYDATGSSGENLIWQDSAHLNHIGGRMLSGLLIQNFWHML